MTRRTRNINFCQNNPDKYKLCSSYICVPVGLSCPCVAKEHFQCSDGKCLPPGFLCDGYRDCADGHDEDICHRMSGQRSLPLAVGVGVGSVVIISVIITIIIVFTKRRKRQCITNEPAKEPLQNGSSTSDPSSSDSPPSSSPNAQFKYDNDTDFYDVLCTSTPRPDTRRLVNPGNLRMGDNQKEKRIQTKTV